MPPKTGFPYQHGTLLGIQVAGDGLEIRHLGNRLTRAFFLISNLSYCIVKSSLFQYAVKEHNARKQRKRREFNELLFLLHSIILIEHSQDMAAFSLHNCFLILDQEFVSSLSQDVFGRDGGLGRHYFQLPGSLALDFSKNSLERWGSDVWFLLGCSSNNSQLISFFYLQFTTIDR